MTRKQLRVVSQYVAVLFVFVCSSSTMAVADLNDGLMAYFAFDEGSGTTVADLSGNANHGSIIGATWGPGVFGQALGFDGSSQFVEIPSAPSIADMGDAMSINTWIQIRPGTNYGGYSWRHILSKGATPGNLWSDYAIGLIGPDSPPAGRLQWQYASDANQHEGNALGDPIEEGAWHMTTATFDQGVIQLYVDAQLLGTLQGSFSTIRSSSESLFIGGRYSDPVEGVFDGLIDEVRIYNRALSTTEIQALVPEPASIAFFALGCLIVLRRRSFRNT